VRQVVSRKSAAKRNEISLAQAKRTLRFVAESKPSGKSRYKANLQRKRGCEHPTGGFIPYISRLSDSRLRKYREH
jgi:hypothetical protein